MTPHQRKLKLSHYPAVPYLATGYMIRTAMKDFDRAGEYLRLREQYRRLSDGELVNLGQNLSELTDIAQQCLTSEISCRCLKVASKEQRESLRRPEPPPDIQDPNDPNYDEDRKLVSIATVWSLDDALQLQDLLDTAGIPFYMGPEKATVAKAVNSNFAEGVGVQIMAIGVPWARLAMKEYAPANDPDYGKVEEEYFDEAAVRCPKCHSREVVLEETEPVQEGVSPEHFQMVLRILRLQMGG